MKLEMNGDDLTPEQMNQKIKEAMEKAAEFAKFLEDPVINKSVSMMMLSQYKAGVRTGLLIGVGMTALVALLAVAL